MWCTYFIGELISGHEGGRGQSGTKKGLIQFVYELFFIIIIIMNPWVKDKIRYSLE